MATLLLWRHFHAPKHDAKLNKPWLDVWHVSFIYLGLGQWMQPYSLDLLKVWLRETSWESNTHRSFCTCILKLNVIQSSETNHHSGKSPHCWLDLIAITPWAHVSYPSCRLFFFKMADANIYIPLLADSDRYDSTMYP